MNESNKAWSRRELIGAGVAGLGVAAGMGLQAQTKWPDKPIKLVVGFPPGGATDVVARIVSQPLADALGTSVVVDNRPGGASTIGMDLVAKAAPDGYTLGVANLSFSINPTLFGTRLPYNTEKDFALVSLVSIVPLVMSVAAWVCDEEALPSSAVCKPVVSEMAWVCADSA